MDQRAGTPGSAGNSLPRPGDVVCGKYRVESVVGTGGMGVVMGAIDTSLGRPVAIKFLSPHKATRAESVARFVREARSAAAIQSEHVVRVFEVGTLPSGAPFIVMEQLRGADLSRVLEQRGGLPIDEACEYVLQACEALGEAHVRGIVHRDLKPQNLFLTHHPDGAPCVKVLDFGISKAADDDGAPNLTSTDMVMGTPLYMSPEQVRSLKNVDARADIWALGAILFELLTATPPFQAPSASALCAMIAMDPPTPLRARRPEAPSELEAVISRCLHKDPAGRFRDVAALAEALAPFVSERGRQSVTRVARVVRSWSGAAPSGQTGSPSGASYPAQVAIPLALGPTEMRSTVGPDPTATDPSRASHPRSPPVLALVESSEGAQLLPSGPHPTTQSTWHHPNTAPAPPAKAAASGVLLGLLGALAGLVLLTVTGAGAWYFVIRKDGTTAATTMADASAPGATRTASATPTLPAPPTAATSVATASARATSSAPSSSPAPAPRKDGGAPSPSPAKDGGAPSPSPDKAEAERIATLGKAAESQCANHRSQMTTFARDEAARKRAAARAKTFMCRGMASSRCERQVCLEACLVLDDQPCIQQIRYVIDHGPPPKY